MAFHTSDLCAVALSNKRSRFEKQSRNKLKEYGDLWKHVNERGQLQHDLKIVLQQIPAKDRHAYFLSNDQGCKLLSIICLQGSINEICYAIDNLRLNELPAAQISSDANFMSPMCSVLRKESPEPNVLWYLAAVGLPVPPRAFCLWAILRCEKTRLLRLLEPLVKFGRNQMPPPIQLIPLLTSEHIEVLRNFVKFTFDEIYLAAHLVNSRPLRLAELNYELATNATERKRLADALEICEVSRHFHTNMPVVKLQYFRESLRFRQGPEVNAEGRLVVGSRRLFESVEDIDRLEQQISEHNYVETAWQIILVASKHHYPLEALTSWLFQEEYVNDLNELLLIKSFILNTNAFLPSTDAATRHRELIAFLSSFYQYCISILWEIQHPPVTLLPLLYDCFQEAVEDGVLREEVREGLERAIFRMNVTELDAQVNKIIERRNESLRIIAVMYDSDFSNESIESIILSLVRFNASLMAPPGQRVSTLYFLLKDNHKVSEELRQELVARICCRMDLNKEQRALLNMDVPGSKVPPLRCFASMKCRGLPRGVLERSIPTSLVSFIHSHPWRMFEDSQDSEYESD